MRILIKNGRVIDPANNINEVMDIFISGQVITKIGKALNNKAEKIIDASNKLVLPGLVDMHVHLREPGREDKETINSGTRAALKGGITSVLAMPNTAPAIDSLQHLNFLKGIIKTSTCANVYIAAAITKDRIGSQVVDIPALKKYGAIAISDDGASVDDQRVFLEALRKAKTAAILVICHCEDKQLSDNGVVNLGFISTKLGLRGISAESEYKRVERDINLAQETGAKVHIAHVSTKESVNIIAGAKKKKIKVTAETAPHYFSLTEEAVCGYDPNMKMNPPLRTKEDVWAIKQALKTGVIDVIASDHAPHTENEKDIEFDRAEFGVIGLETELAVSITELVDPDICRGHPEEPRHHFVRRGDEGSHKGVLDWAGLVKKMSLNPARILGIDKGTLGVGKDADIIVVNPDKEWVVRKEEFISKSKNSAFIGSKLKGVVEWTICRGNISYNYKRTVNREQKTDYRLQIADCREKPKKIVSVIC